MAMDKKQVLKNKGFICIMIIYVSLFIADFATTMSNSEILQYVETNALYRLTGSLLLPVLLNLLVIWLLWKTYHYKKTKPLVRFFLITILVITCLVRILAIHNALQWSDLPPDVKMEHAQTTYSEANISQFQKVIAILIYSPVIYCMLCYFIWNFDHKTSRKDDQQ